MKRALFAMTAVIVAVGVILPACGQKRITTEDAEGMPEWYLNVPPSTDEFVYFSGMGEPSTDARTSFELAQTNVSAQASQAISQTVEEKIREASKTITVPGLATNTERLAQRAAQYISQSRLAGGQVEKRHVENLYSEVADPRNPRKTVNQMTYRAYVLMSYPRSTVDGFVSQSLEGLRQELTRDSEEELVDLYDRLMNSPDMQNFTP